MKNEKKLLAIVAATGALVAVPVDATERGSAMVTVPAGTYQMGRTVDYGYGDMDGPTHTVTLGSF